MAISGPHTSGGGVFDSINITPLTDIFLVLLIIFMVTTSVTIESAAHVDLPQATNTAPENKGVIVTYTTQHELFVNSKDVPERELSSSLREALGLDQPLYVQFFIYVKSIMHGDLGTSWQTTRPVLEDLMQRFPATLELVTLSLLLAVVVGITLGVFAAKRPNGWVARLADLYGLSAGALPDFWFALVLIFALFEPRLGLGFRRRGVA